MSEEMAVGDIAKAEEAVINGAEAAAASTLDLERTLTGVQEPLSDPGSQEFNVECQVEREGAEPEPPEPGPEPAIIAEPSASTSEPPAPESTSEADKRGVKRRASSAFSNEKEPDNEDFKGFESVEQKDISMDYSRVLERLQAEVEAEKKMFTPLKYVSANITALKRANKRQRQDTSGSRPSSGLSMRSDGESVFSNEAYSSPGNRGRRVTVEISSPLLRVPLDKGWKRELVYRAALDPHQRRNADIYYYTPQGKKLRSTREVSEHLHGTGLTLENFSFFKEPLGIDDPEKEVVRDAKVMRKDSPIQSPAPVVVEGKRAPKPKPPKGVSPVNLKSPPAKIKVKSMGSRLSGSGPSPVPKKKATADNNNTATWKKPRPHPHQPDGDQHGHQPGYQPETTAPVYLPTSTPGVWERQSREFSEGSSDSEVGIKQVQPPPAPPPPLQSRPTPADASPEKPTKQVVQPCSLTCGMGVPSLACRVCLCLFHPACANYWENQNMFTCKNCYSGSCPPSDPPPLIHKSGVPSSSSLPAPQPRRVPVSDQRVLLRMKVAGGGPDGERVWAVAKPNQTPKPTPTPSKPTPTPSKPTPTPSKPTPVTTKPTQPPKPVNIPKPSPIPTQVPSKPIPVPGKVKKINVPKLVPMPSALAIRPTLPQSLAMLNGRRFIVVPRSMVQQPSAKP